MKDSEKFVIEDGVLVKYNGHDEDIVVPYGVTKIGTNAFRDCRFAKSITLPEGLESLYSNLPPVNKISFPSTLNRFFAYWINIPTLTEIDVAEDNPDLKSIDGALYSKDGAILYHYCSARAATEFAVPHGVEEIGYHAFHGAKNLKYVSLPSTLRTISANGFKNCCSLEKIVLPDNIARMEKETFSGCFSLKSVSLPKKLKTISTEAFYGCASLERLEFPDKVAKIASSAFARCTLLKSVVFNDGLLEIGSSAFEQCTSLTQVAIPSTVKKVGKNAFKKCPLVDVKTLPVAPVLDEATPGNPVFKYEVKAKSCKATLVNIYDDDKELVFPSEFDGHEVTEIAIDRNCKNKLLKKISLTPFEKVVVPGTIKKYGNTLNNLNIQNLIFEEGIKVITPIHQANIVDLYLPISLEVIDKFAFSHRAITYATSIKSIHIPKNTNLQYIGVGAFPFNRDGTVSNYILSCCTVEGDAVYLPSEDNPHFILVKVPKEGAINENTELVLPNEANESVIETRTMFLNSPQKWIVPVTLRQILKLEKEYGKCLYIDEKWELRGEELFNAKGEKAGDLDSSVFINYFYFHGGYFWNQYDLSKAPPAPLFGYRGWKYLSEKKGHRYIKMAEVILCTVKEDGSIDYDFDYDTGIPGTLDILSSPQAFNLINCVDSEAG